MRSRATPTVRYRYEVLFDSTWPWASVPILWRRADHGGDDAEGDVCQDFDAYGASRKARIPHPAGYGSTEGLRAGHIYPMHTGKTR